MSNIFENLFSDLGDGFDLPEPNVTTIPPDDGEITNELIEGIMCNPIYAGIGPYPPLVTEAQWMTAAKRYAEEHGLEQFLVNVIFVLRQSFADFGQ